MWASPAMRRYRISISRSIPAASRRHRSIPRLSPRRRATTRCSCSEGVVGLGDHPLEDAQGIERHWHAAVDRHLQQHLAYLLRWVAPKGDANVRRQLVGAVQYRQCGNGTELAYIG